MKTTQKVQCNECNEEKELMSDDATAVRLIASQRCWDCDFWYRLYILRDDQSVIRIDGKHYHLGMEFGIAEEDKAFGGRKFKIRRLNGCEITTTNLSFNGVIPANFKDRLPDNAEFMEDKK